MATTGSISIEEIDSAGFIEEAEEGNTSQNSNYKEESWIQIQN